MPAVLSEEKRDARGRFKPGGAPKSPGRPAVARDFREWCQNVLQHGHGRQVIQAMLDADGEDRRFAVRLIVEYAYGKPQQYVDVTTGGQPLIKAYIDLELDQVCP
jgi:hypothetical protein